jgi:hypothetical protein
MRIRLYIMLIATTACFALVMYLNTTSSGSWDHRRQQAQSEIQGIATSIAMYQADTGASLALGSEGCTDPNEFAGRVIDQLCPSVQVQRVPAFGRKEYLLDLRNRVCGLALLDPWGRPYRMTLQKADRGTAQGGPAAGIFIWSVGGNGVDEGGQGDDVVWPDHAPGGNL